MPHPLYPTTKFYHIWVCRTVCPVVLIFTHSMSLFNMLYFLFVISYIPVHYIYFVHFSSSAFIELPSIVLRCIFSSIFRNTFMFHWFFKIYTVPCICIYIYIFIYLHVYTIKGRFAYIFIFTYFTKSLDTALPCYLDQKVVSYLLQHFTWVFIHNNTVQSSYLQFEMPRFNCFQ